MTTVAPARAPAGHATYPADPGMKSKTVQAQAQPQSLSAAQAAILRRAPAASPQHHFAGPRAIEGVGGVEAAHAGEGGAESLQQILVVAHGAESNALAEKDAVDGGFGTVEHVQSRHSGSLASPRGRASGRVERGVVGTGGVGAGGEEVFGGGDAGGAGMETADSLYAHLQGKLRAPAPLSLTINSPRLAKLSVALSMNSILALPSPCSLGLCARDANGRKREERLTKAECAGACHANRHRDSSRQAQNLRAQRPGPRRQLSQEQQQRRRRRRRRRRRHLMGGRWWRLCLV